MKQTKQWNVDIDGVQNTVVFAPNRWSGKHKLMVNGNEVELKQSLRQTLIGMDQPINIAGKECRFVLIGNKADIAVDGTYIDSKKPYVPLKSMPWWTWIFMIACIAIPVVSLGGALPAVIAFLGVTCCVRVSVSPNTKAAIKLLCCLGISILAWALFGILLFVASGI